MKTVKPSFYDNFICIADKCPYTCCREWDIEVDKQTALKWRNFSVPDEATLLSTRIKYGKGENVLKLNGARKCTLLNECGLCRVVLAYGEENIPETCHIFPREERLFQDRTEKYLSPACPHVLDLIWEQEEPELTENEDDQVESDPEDRDLSRELSSFLIRDWFLNMMRERKDPAGKMLRVYFCILSDMKEILSAGVHDKNRSERSSAAMPDPAFVRSYKEATNISEVFEALAAEPESEQVYKDRFSESNEIFLDVVNRYVKQKKYEDVLDLMVPLAEKLSEDGYSDIEKILPLWKKCSCLHEKFLRKLVWEEIACSMISECSIDSLLVRTEWIILEYITVKQALFLRWCISRELSYEEIRESTAVMMRIMGYADREIENFMKAEFESVFWPNDYAFLVI